MQGAVHAGSDATGVRRTRQTLGWGREGKGSKVKEGVESGEKGRRTTKLEQERYSHHQIPNTKIQ